MQVWHSSTRIVHYACAVQRKYDVMQLTAYMVHKPKTEGKGLVHFITWMTSVSTHDVVFVKIPATVGIAASLFSLKNLYTYRYKWFHCLPVETQSCTHSGRTLVHSHTCDHTRHWCCHTHWCLERRERIRERFNQSQGHIWPLDRKLKSFHC